MADTYGTDAPDARPVTAVRGRRAGIPGGDAPAVGSTPRGRSAGGTVLAVLNNKWFLRAAAFVVILLLWEWAFSEERVNPILAAPLSKVIERAPDVVTGELYLDSLLQTLRLFAVGVVLSVGLGTLAGFLLGRNEVLNAGLTPWVNGLAGTPLVALAPLLTATFGYEFRTNVIIVVLVSVLPVLINAEQGARNVDRTLLEVAGSFGSRGWRTWRDVIFPATVPFLLVGVRLGVARALIGTAVAETYAAPGGLGYLLIRYGFRFDTASMLVVVMTFTLIALLFYGLLGLVNRTRVAQWRVGSD